VHARVKTGPELTHGAYDCWAKRARISKAAHSRRPGTSRQVARAVVRTLLRQVCLDPSPADARRQALPISHPQRRPASCFGSICKTSPILIFRLLAPLLPTPSRFSARSLSGAGSPTVLLLRSWSTIPEPSCTAHGYDDIREHVPLQFVVSTNCPNIYMLTPTASLPAGDGPARFSPSAVQDWAPRRKSVSNACERCRRRKVASPSLQPKSHV
jgi:hypothetical protein